MLLFQNSPPSSKQTPLLRTPACHLLALSKPLISTFLFCGLPLVPLSDTKHSQYCWGQAQVTGVPKRQCLPRGTSRCCNNTFTGQFVWIFLSLWNIFFNNVGITTSHLIRKSILILVGIYDKYFISMWFSGVLIWKCLGFMPVSYTHGRALGTSWYLRAPPTQPKPFYEFMIYKIFWQ